MSFKRHWGLLFVICLHAVVYGKEPLPIDEGLKSYPSQVFFEENLGQYEAGIHYQTSVPEHLVRFMENGLSIARVREIEVRDESKEPESEKHVNFRWSKARSPEHEGLVWNIHFVNAQEGIQPVGKKALPGYVNYLIGSDSSSWVSRVPRYRELWYENLYEGIDLRYYGSASHQLKYDFILQPDADVRNIQMEWEGVEQLSLDKNGNLQVETYWGAEVDMAPYAYQMIAGEEVPVEVEYQQLLAGTIGFRILGDYQPEYPLIIDPLTLTWSSFFHASTSDDYVMSVCRDAMNFVYFTGYTKVLNFPTTSGVFQNTYAGGIDAYVTKMAADGSSMIYSTYLGGSDWEIAYGIGVNASQEPYVAGFCRSSDFPVSTGSVQPTSNGGLVEGFLTKLSSDGSSLLYGTYVGGTGRDYLYDLVVKPGGEAYVTGYTLSSDFPATTGAYSGGPQGNGDIFVAKYNATGTIMEYGVLLGGTNYDIANGLAVDDDGEAFIVGNTGSTDFPVTTGVIQNTANFGGGINQEDAFIVKLNASGNAVEYATYLGGTSGDAAYSVDVNAAEEAFLTGMTYSTDFPTTGGAFQPVTQSPSGLGDGFVARINPNGTSLQYSTYLGGSGLDYGKAIRIESSTSTAHIVGATQSSDFPVTAGANAYISQYDIFVSILSADGSSLEHGNLYGGSYNDYPRGASSIYVENDKITLGITTHSGDVPMTPGTYQGTKTNGVSDAPWLIGIEMDVVLSMEMQAFVASWNSDDQWVELSWEMNQEQGSSATFTLERNSPLGEWEAIHSLEGKNERSSYLWQDQEAGSFAGQMLMYRIRYTADNGESLVSQVRELKIPAPSQAKMSLSPNPANDLVRISCLLPERKQAFIQVTDLTGRTLYYEPLEVVANRSLTQEKVVSLKGWAPGVYILKLDGISGPAISQKLLILR